MQGTPEGVEDNGSLTRVAAFPIGMDPEAFAKALTEPDVMSHIKQLLARYSGRKARPRCGRTWRPSLEISCAGLPCTVQQRLPQHLTHRHLPGQQLDVLLPRQAHGVPGARLLQIKQPMHTAASGMPA